MEPELAAICCSLHFNVCRRLIHHLHAFEQTLGMGIVWPSVLVATGVCSYYTLKYEDIVTALLGSGFATSLLLSLINTLGAAAVRCTMDIEGWHPRLITAVSPHPIPSCAAVLCLRCSK